MSEMCEVVNEELGELIREFGEEALVNAWRRVERMKERARENNRKRQMEIKVALKEYRERK